MPKHLPTSSTENYSNPTFVLLKCCLELILLMKIILSEMTASLVGTLERGLGYHIEHRKNGFFSKRNQKSFVPPDGHWRFIVLCAELAQNKLHISDIEVSRKEIVKAFKEAGYIKPHYELVKFADDYPETFSANDVLTLKYTFGL